MKNADMNSSQALTENEFMSAYLRSLKEEEEQQLLRHAEKIAAFKELAAERGVTLSDANFSYFRTIGIIASAPSLLERLVGPIIREKDGLIPFDALENEYVIDLHRSGYLQSKQFSLMAHPHFRRGLSGLNSYAPLFVALFWRFERNDVSRYIALDEDRVKVNVDNGYIVELDTWYGAPFNEDISKIPGGVSKLRPPLDLSDSHVSTFFADAYCLDIKWSREDDIKTFQALEIKSEHVSLELDGERVFPARYVHAEFDVQAGVFRHFDGAMQYLTESEYLQRRDSDFNYNMKSRDQIKSRSKKLFKLNGRIEKKDWAEFCCHFFVGNPLVCEYFTGCYPDHVIEALSRIEAARHR
jgi:hypothetical protein